ncbi:hypothetical protein EBQ90_03225 [bacterium]|nr:hypothetical protein [bacterium]
MRLIRLSEGRYRLDSEPIEIRQVSPTVWVVESDGTAVASFPSKMAAAAALSGWILSLRAAE